MKINKWIALAVIALLVVGAMGFVSYRVFASTFGSAASQDCSLEAQEDNAIESAEAADANEQEYGQQEEGEVENGDASEVVEANGQDTSDEVAPSSTGITADEAQAIVEKENPGAETLAVEFDREGGKDMWEVELVNGMDVKVDATTGEILYTEKRD